MKTQFSQFPVSEDVLPGPAQVWATTTIDSHTVLRSPRVADGADIWHIAADSGVLDTNSSYAYLMWCRDFAATSMVAEIGRTVAGFVIGYRRQEAPGTLFVWQVAVDHPYRGLGLGVSMLDRLLDDLSLQGVSTLETTISPDNKASIAMFAALARRRGAALTSRPLFERPDFPDPHEPELLYRITPTHPEE
ncbi:diaminobutyrate acetyltransferase [Nocardia huaxiensis]|uniref:L-2,4-diaminobutyric acid acetyltransferase n=1 Tax=Nocardia huaxiensis TaxID=2755382 RepID=A0A7D6VCY4_9NOCA|nr:diaminobutyrate acetyltransferase [Nocardia huaxiensis]QLY32033.1 diaminobutyrate acetyltransferase [Nocardia huaxiensis]